MTRGGPGVLGNPGSSVWYYANTDNRKDLSFYYNGDYGGDQFNSSRHGFNPGFNWRATSSMSLNMSVRYSINHDDSQWVENTTLEAARRATCSAGSTRRPCRSTPASTTR